MTIGVSFSTPAPGSAVNRTFTVTGTWVDDGQVDAGGHDRFFLTQIVVQFGAGHLPLSVATINQDGTWSASGTLLPSVRHGDSVAISFTAAINAESTNNPGDGLTEFQSDTRTVVVESVPPNVVIDAFPNDRTVGRLPFRLPLLSGRASDADGVSGVLFAIDGGARQNVDSVTGDPSQVAWSKANIDLGAGRHTLTVIATDSFGNEGTASAEITVRLDAPPPPPPPPPPPGDISFTPEFRHTNWVNNVDRIAAGGPNGFNVRYDAIEDDLRQMSAVVGRIGAALQSPGAVAGEQRLAPGLDFVTLAAAGAGGWLYDEAGVVTPERPGGGQAIMDLVLPERITLRSFRALGRYAGAPTAVAIRLFRSSLTDQSLPPEQLAEITLGAGTGTPYDISVPIPAASAKVDGLFRHYVVLVAGQVSLTAIVELSALQLAYTAA